MIKKKNNRVKKSNYKSKKKSGFKATSKKRNIKRIKRYKQPTDYKRYVFNPKKKNKNDYIPINSFRDFNLDEILYINLVERGYLNPTEVQDRTIDSIQKGQDVLAIAQTGTGKTGAYLIPLINLTLRKEAYNTLILVPTRELANQVKSEFSKFTKDLPLKAVVVVGKENVSTQLKALDYKHNFVVATPGRLLDIIESDKYSVQKFNKIVLDEVDRMLDMGFAEDVLNIVRQTSQYKQFIFVSATSNPKTAKLIEKICPEVETIKVDKAKPALNVNQDVITFRTDEDKIETLHDVLIRKSYEKGIVFVNKKTTADDLHKELLDRGFKVDAIHGDKTQARRKKAISKLKEGKINVLVATDIAGRGIDIDDISHIINYDEPLNYYDYIHRVGRTGRAGKTGSAITFIKQKRLKD